MNKYVAFREAFILLALHNRFETSRGEVCRGSSTNYTNKSVLDVDSLQSSRSLALTLERLTMRVCTQAKIYVNFHNPCRSSRTQSCATLFVLILVAKHECYKE